MSTHYELNCGQYVMHRDGKPVLRPLDEVAIAFSVESDGLHILHKHGAPEAVKAWAEQSRAKLRVLHDPVACGMADAIQVIQGKFQLDDLNRVLERSGGLELLLGKHNAIDIDAVEMSRERSQTAEPPEASIPTRMR